MQAKQNNSNAIIIIGILFFVFTKGENTNTICNNAQQQQVKRLHETLFVQSLAYCLIFFS